MKNSFILAYKAKSTKHNNPAIFENFTLLTGIAFLKPGEEIPTTSKKENWFFTIDEQLDWSLLFEYLKNENPTGIVFKPISKLDYFHLQLMVNVKLHLPKLKILLEVSDKLKAGDIQSMVDIGIDGFYAERLDEVKLEKLVKELHFRNGEKISNKHIDKLKKLRKKIDQLDDDLLKLLSKRIKTVEALAEIKAKNNVPIVQVKRWKEVLQLTLEHAEETGIDKDSIAHIMEVIHLNAIKIQKRVYKIK